MSWFSKLFESEKETPKVSAEALVPKAQAYIEAAQAPAKKPTVQFQKWSTDDSQVKYSLRDNYSGDSIRSAMKSGTRSSNTDWDLLSRDLSAYLNVGFVEQMEELIREKKLKDSTVYKAAQIDRRLFSKIVSDRSYKPAKDTCLAIALALELTPSQADDLLSRAGYTLSHSNKRDVVLEFCFNEKIYDVNMVNDLLYRLGEKTLGR